MGSPSSTSTEVFREVLTIRRQTVEIRAVWRLSIFAQRDIRGTHTVCDIEKNQESISLLYCWFAKNLIIHNCIDGCLLTSLFSA